MTKERAKSEIMQIYGALSPDKQRAIDTLVKIEPCDDVVSIETVIEWLKAKDIIKMSSQEETARRELKALPSVEQKPCDDAISRQAVLEWIKGSLEQYANTYSNDMLNMWMLFEEQITAMPPVKQETTTKNDLADERRIDKWNIGDKEAEAWSVKGKLQIRHRGVIHNVNLSDFFLEIPSKPKIGHWIKTGVWYQGAYESLDYFECSCCHVDTIENGNYCPNCGARMFEPQESEEV